jgi:hypothetical protein
MGSKLEIPKKDLSLNEENSLFDILQQNFLGL